MISFREQKEEFPYFPLRSELLCISHHLPNPLYNKNCQFTLDSRKRYFLRNQLGKPGTLTLDEAWIIAEHVKNPDVVKRIYHEDAVHKHLKSD